MVITNINTIFTHHREIIHRHDLTFENLFHFDKSQDEACRRHSYHITSKVANEQRGRNLTQTNVDSRRTIKLPQRTTNSQPISIDIIVEEEEDLNQEVSAIEVPALQTIEAQAVDEPAKQEDKQYESLHAKNEASQRRRPSPCLQYEGGQSSSVRLVETRNRETTCHSYYCNEHVSPQCTLKLHQTEHLM